MQELKFERLKEQRYSASADVDLWLTADIPAKYLSLNYTEDELSEWFDYYDGVSLDNENLKKDLDFIYKLFGEWIESTKDCDDNGDSDITFLFEHQKNIDKYKKDFFRTHDFRSTKKEGKRAYYLKGSELDTALKNRDEAWSTAYKTGQDTKNIYMDSSFLKDVPAEEMTLPESGELKGLRVYLKAQDSIDFDGYSVPDSWEEPGYSDDNSEDQADAIALDMEKSLKKNLQKNGYSDISVDVSWNVDYDGASYDSY